MENIREEQDDVAKMHLDKELATKCSLNCRFVNAAFIWHGSGLITSLTEVQRIQSCLVIEITKTAN